MTLVADLFALQEIDTAIDGRVATLESLRAAYGESEAAAEVRVEIAAHAAGLPELTSQQRDLELQVGRLRERGAEIEKKLYGGSVTNARELQDLQGDFDQLARQRDRVEEELLALLEQVEAKQGGVRAGEARLREIEAAWSGDQARMQADDQRIEVELSGLRGQREEQAAKVPPPLLDRYDRLRRRRKGVAVSKVQRGVCLGCRLSIPPAVLQRARSGTNPDPPQCPSCERILYVI